MKPEFASTNPSRISRRWTLVRSSLIFGAMLTLSWVGTAHAATDLFLRWPGIVGESAIPGHAGDIILKSYSQSASNADTAVPLVVGKSVCGQIVITKLIDQSSPHFLGLVLRGTPTTGPVIVTFAKAGLTEPTYYTVTLNNVVVTSVTQSDSTSGDIITETITLLAAKFSFAFRPQRPDGTFGAPVTFGWDCGTNRAI